MVVRVKRPQVKVVEPYLLVQSVTPNSKLADAGLLPGDALVALDGKSFDTIEEFSSLLGPLLLLTVSRGVTLRFHCRYVF